MSTSVPSPMPGTIVKVLVKVGDKVQEDDTVVILEAMKMEISIAAPCAGEITEVLVADGQQVGPEEALCTIA